MAYRHIVIFTIRQPDDLVQAISTLAALGRETSQHWTEWQVVQSEDIRKGTVVGEIAVFPHKRAFRAYTSSEAHRQAAAVMSAIADWPGPLDFEEFD
ncbi:MAG: hypothetical protein ACHQUB_03155 [Candidatus Saccharimonadia bacterium]